MIWNVLKNASNQNTDHVDFGLVDSKGRKIGANIYTATLEYIPFVEGEHSRWAAISIAAGVYFTFRPQITKNGKEFGASQDRRYFNTEAECKQAIEAYLTSAKKRHS